MRILFSAGGTGGHLYPALALADYIKSQNQDVQILFVGSKYRIEAQVVEQYNYDFIGLDVKTPSGSLFRKFKGYYDVFSNISRCENIIDDFKPDIVIGFGGYTSYSIMKAALNKNIKTILHEQNSVVGKSNKTLASKVDLLITTYDDIKNQVSAKKILNYMNPTSYHVLMANKANLEDYSLSNELKTILIVMGSQGSSTIDKVVSNILKDFKYNDIQIIYICGTNYIDNYQGEIYPDNIKVLGYENNLSSLIKACDLIVSRSGASALSEIISANKPSILIPSVHVTNNHQYYNALPLVNNHSSTIIEENESLQVNLENEMITLINDQERLNMMIKATNEFNYSDSAMNIYQAMLDLMEDNNEK